MNMKLSMDFECFQSFRSQTLILTLISQAFIGSFIRVGREYPQRPGTIEMYQYRRWHGHTAIEFGHDCCLLLHQLHHYRVVQLVTEQQDEN